MQPTTCASTQSMGGMAIMDSAGLEGSFSGCSGPQSPENKWTVSVGDEHKVQVSRHPLSSKPSLGLTSIDEVDSLDKVKDVVDKAEVDVCIKATEDVWRDVVTPVVVDVLKV